MGLDINNRNTELIIDKYGLVTTRDAMEKEDLFKSHGDCIGNTCDAYMAYDYEPFIQAVKNCFLEKKNKHGKSYVQAYRTPYSFFKRI